MLHEEAICGFEALTANFALDVGFDYYMYTGAVQPCPRAVALAKSIGLLVEPKWPSPQLVNDREES